MSRAIVLRSAQVVIDVLVLSMALWLAVLLRFEGDIPRQMLKRILFLWPYVVALQYGALVLTGTSRFAWRYIGLREAVRIFRAVAIGAASLTLLRFGAAWVLSIEGYGQYSYLPLGVIGIDFLLAFLGLSATRVTRRLSTERAQVRRLKPGAPDLVPTLLVGAGRGGVMVAKEIEGRPELGILPVGFIDDDPVKHGNVIHGVRVLGCVADVRRIARQYRAKQAIITIANAPGQAVRNISDVCQLAGLQVKVIPGLFQLVGGDLNLTRIRDVAIEDLLRRDAVSLDTESIAEDLGGRVVLVTGAGGSIGSEICRQVARFKPSKLVLVERSENALFEIHRELGAACPGLELTARVTDIRDRPHLERIFREVAPNVIFHAAAHKHVPMMEWNPAEAVRNNVLGTRQIADLAHQFGATSFVMISTDKAVNPSSVMGTTKRVAELYVQALARSSSTRFVTVRFGNVLGSNGSVVPIFKEQIAKGGPVTITHPDMKRYFMTIPEACQLVLEAGSMGAGGEIFILDMGKPVRIVDLAHDLIRLSGFQVGEIELAFTGMRPGEKLYEELSVAEENVERTRHPKVFIGKTTAQDLKPLTAQLDHFAGSLDRLDDNQIRGFLRRIVPEYNPSLRASGPPVQSGDRLVAATRVAPSPATRLGPAG